MTVYKNPDDFFKALDKAVDEGFSDFVQETQGLLTSRAPIDTGRLASSFYITKSQPSNEVRPADWAPPGAKKQSKPEYEGKIKADGTWYITNNVPYADRVAYDPVYGKNGRGFGAAWYTATVNQNSKRLEDAMTRSLRKLQ
jgi:hypothetical protein